MEKTEKMVPLRSCHLPLLPTTSYISATFASKSCQTSVTSISTLRCATLTRWTIPTCIIITIITRMAMVTSGTTGPPRWPSSSRKRSQLRLRRRPWTRAQTTLKRRRWCHIFITTCSSTLNTTISNLRRHSPPLIIKFWRQMDTSLQTS